MLIEQLRRRFFDYVDRFYSKSKNGFDDHPIQLKRDHTRRVCRNARMLANKLKLSDADALIAEVTALFHDVGRFKQYRIYQTFKDADSENHAALSVAEIKRNSFLDGLSEADAALVLQCIELHNAVEIPDYLSDRERFFLQLLRDADKLDIWKVFTEYYENKAKAATDSVSLGLPDSEKYSEKALAAVCERKVVRMPEMKTLNDFKLLQISWVYDINFAPTMAAMLEKGYIDRLYAFLPHTGEIRAAFEKVHQYAESAAVSG